MDRGGAEGRPTRLLVRTPNRTHGDQTIDGVDPDWTVLELKTHLSAVYPSRPAVGDQRLIYSGKLLADHLLIKDIFRQADSIPTLHLVCAVRTPAVGPLGARPKVREMEQTHSPPSTSASGPGSAPGSTPGSAPLTQGPASSTTASGYSRPSTPSAVPELRQRRQASSPSAPAAWPGTSVPGVPDMAAPTFPHYSLYSPEQLLWLQHVYARQYYMQYHAALAAAGSASLAPPTTIGTYPAVPAPQAPVPAAIPNQNPMDNLPANQNAAQEAPLIIPGAADQNMRMNAQGGPVMEDEDDVERDWLDWMYTASRLGVFLFIVYFYSSLSRFIMVMSSLLLMYLHTAGWFPFRRRPVVPQVNPQQNHQNQNQNQNQGEEPAGRNGEEPADIGEGPDGQGPMAAVLVPPHRVSIMWTAWVFFKTFFASLIPEAPVAN